MSKLTGFEQLIYHVIYGGDAEFVEEHYPFVKDIANRVLLAAKEENEKTPIYDVKKGLLAGMQSLTEKGCTTFGGIPIVECVKWIQEKN